MIEQTSSVVTFFFQYFANSAGKTGLTDVTVSVTRLPDNTPIVTDQAATELDPDRHPGLYYYVLDSSLDITRGDYVATAHTSSAVDNQDIPALWGIGRGGIDLLKLLSQGRIAVNFPIVPDNVVHIFKGDDYTLDAGRPLEWAEVEAASWPPDITDATVTFTALPVKTNSATFTKEGDVIVATGSSKRVRLELDHDETGSLDSGIGSYTYRVLLTLADGVKVTIAQGRVTVE